MSFEVSSRSARRPGCAPGLLPRAAGPSSAAGLPAASRAAAGRSAVALAAALLPAPPVAAARPAVLLLAPLLAAALLAAGCSRGARAPEAGGVVLVRLAPVVLADVARPVLATGTLGAKDEVPLSFKVGGVLARVDVEAGQSVRAGQVLAALEQPEIAAQVAKARAGAEKADRDLARARSLYADSVVTQELYENAQTAHDVASNDLEIARYNERHALVVAPAAGTVLRRLADPGQTVAPGTPIVVLGSAGSPQVVRAGLADRDAARLAIGDSAAVAFGALPGGTWRGVVSRIGAAATPGTGAYEIEVRLAAPVRLSEGGSLASGLVADLTLVPARRERVSWVPASALIEGDGERASVWTLERGAPRRLDVRVAFLDGDRAAIASGLEGVAAVVDDGAAYLTPTSRVRMAGAER